MYSIFSYILGTVRANVGKYSIHGAHGGGISRWNHSKPLPMEPAFDFNTALGGEKA